MATNDLKNPADKVRTEEDTELDAPYIDKRVITLSLIHNYSLYRKVNMKTMGHKTETIGSSIQSSRTLLASTGELESYLPSILGLSPTNPEFISKARQWFANMRLIVSNNDVKIDASFYYNHKRDYIKIQNKEREIEKEYDKIDRSNIATVKNALKRKIDAINNLESTKYLYGHPIDISSYYMYRHCLLYNDVAKDTALINSNPNYRFYIKDEAKEKMRQDKFTNDKLMAMQKFLELNRTEAKFEAAFVSICVLNNSNLSVELTKSKTEKQKVLMEYIDSNPEKFIKIVDDKYIEMKSDIEKLIINGELIRSEYNQQINMPDGTFIGSNINDAINFLNNTDNKAIWTALQNKLKMI